MPIKYLLFVVISRFKKLKNFIGTLFIDQSFISGLENVSSPDYCFSFLHIFKMDKEASPASIKTSAALKKQTKH